MVTGINSPSHAHRILPRDDPQKLASLHAVGPLFVILGAAWFFYFKRRDLFPDKSAAYLILAASSFSITSVSMHTLNKVCVSFTNAPSTVTSIQMIIAVVCFLSMHTKEILGANRQQLTRWCVVPIVYAAMLNTSLLGYQYLTLTLVTVFRNVAPLVTLAVEGCIMPPEQKPQVSPPVLASLLICVVGAAMFSWTSTAFSWIGLGLVIVNTLVAIFDRLLQRRLLVEECKDLPLSACMTVNNSLGVIPTLLLALGTGEFEGIAANVTNWTDPGVVLLLLMSGFMGLGIGLFGLMCQKAMTATSFQVLQNASKVVVVSMGVGIFGDKIDSPARIMGILLSLAGSAAYGYARSLEQVAKTKKEGFSSPIKDACIKKETANLRLAGSSPVTAEDQA
jgi:drug/metabolite transporter (DMT)-like permease